MQMVWEKRVRLFLSAYSTVTMGKSFWAIRDTLLIDYLINCLINIWLVSATEVNED